MIFFRIDDISLNTNREKISNIIDIILNKYVNSNIILGISPIVHDMKEFSNKKQERIFPEILNAYSDFRVFYNVDKIGIPFEIINNLLKYKNIKLAGHGLIHVDHRLLTKDVQELSIMVSCNLIKSKIFIPPFNKYNKYTEEICDEQNIELIKFEDGWKHLLYQKIDNNFNKYYFHSHDFTLEEFNNTI